MAVWIFGFRFMQFPAIPPTRFGLIRSLALLSAWAAFAAPALASDSFEKMLASRNESGGLAHLHEGLGGLEQGDRNPWDWVRENGYDGGDVSHGSVVPEPDSVVLLIAGLGAVAILVARRARR
jgi:hypothetical protein